MSLNLRTLEAKAVAIPARFFWGILAPTVLALSSSYAALVMRSANWAATQRLRAIYPDDETRTHILPHDGMPIRAFTAGAWERAQVLFGVGALLLLATWLLLGLALPAGRRELQALGTELRLAGSRAWQAWRALPVWQRRVFASNLLLLSGVRLYLGWTLMWNDDATSYDLFVRHGLVAVGAYYPLPNNHELSNLISLGFYQLYPGFWWSMRLPVLLTSTAGTVLLFLILVRRLGYWPALLAAGAASWLNPSLYYAAHGRGYWLLLLLTGLLFWALLALLDPPRAVARERAAWLLLVGAGVLGSYAVPTFAYVLFSAWSWLGWQALRRRQWALLGRAVLAGLLVLGGSAICYGPTLYVSGWRALVDNPYLYPQPLYQQPHTWQALPTYLWLLESYLGGQLHWGAFVPLLALSVFGWAAWQARAGHLPAAGQQQLQQVGWPALWFMGSAYVLLPVLRVLPPERTWLYKSWFCFVLLAVGLAQWSWPRARRWALGMVVGLFASYQVSALLLDHRGYWQYHANHSPGYKQPRAYEWFATHIDVPYPGGPVAPPATVLPKKAK